MAVRIVVPLILLATLGCGRITIGDVCRLFPDRCTPPTTTTTTMPRPPVTTPPQPSACSAPQDGVTVKWVGPGPVLSTRGEVVARVLSHLTGCQPGSDCPHGEGPGHDENQRWMARVIACLRDSSCVSKATAGEVGAGLCAGQHSNGHTDEISVLGRVWEQYKVGNVGGGTVVWPAPWGSGDRPSWVPMPLSQPPSPPPASCSLDPGHEIRVKVDVRRGGAGAVWLDVTYEYFHGEGPGREPLGPCGRRWCDLGVDGGPEGVPCQNELAGDPVFIPLSDGLTLIPRFRDNNPNIAQVQGSLPGRAKACSSRQPDVCKEVDIP